MLNMAAFLPSGKIAAVVAMNCMVNSLACALNYKGKRALSGESFNLIIFYCLGIV